MMAWTVEFRLKCLPIMISHCPHAYLNTPWNSRGAVAI